MSNEVAKEGIDYGAQRGGASVHRQLLRSPGAARVATTAATDVVTLIAAAGLALLGTAHFEHAPLLKSFFAVFPNQEPAAFVAMVAIIPWCMFFLYALGLYREWGTHSITGDGLTEAAAGFMALTSASWVALLIVVIAEGSRAPLGALVVFWLAAVVLVPMARWLVRTMVWSRRSFVDRTLIIGAGDVGHMLAAKIAKTPRYRIKLVGFLDDGEPLGSIPGLTVPLLGSFKDLGDIIERESVTRVIVAFSRARHQAFLKIVRTCADHNVAVSIVPRLFEVVSSRVAIDEIEGIPLLDVANVELSSFNMFMKRCFDIVFGSLLLLLASPILIAVSVAVKLDSPGPVFFRQERMGRGGRVFRIFKFRSMGVGADDLRTDLTDSNEYSGPMFKMHEDPRATHMGRLIRRWSLDELPQLFNVLKGEMSLVGPRPLWVEEARQCKGWAEKRLDITPGITGLWQVMGRNDIPFDEMIKLDYWYVTGWSIGWDIRLLLETIPAVLGRRGAY